jgi:UDP-N-acetylmuramate--alanine ligase
VSGDPGVLELLDLAAPRRIHVVAVGGTGMGPIALVLAAMGHTVTGSDLHEPTNRAELETAGITVTVGHDARNIGDAEVLAVSSAIGDDNAEVVAARERGLPVLRRTSVLGAIARLRRTIAVAGTHGKTTTSAFIATVLRDAGLDPSFVIGAPVQNLGGAGHWGSGEWFVVEADESDGTFLALAPEIAVVTNLEPDHVEFWGGIGPLVDAFRTFIADAPVAIVCDDDRGVAELGRAGGATTYGMSRDSTWRLTDVATDRAAVSFRLANGGADVGTVRVAAPGAHNARNAAAAIAAAVSAGVDAAAAVRGLSAFTGVSRRFELRGEAGGVTFVDSYDHLPGEVAAVLETAAQGGWRRVVCVFQPHRYSRIAALGADFRDAFVAADKLAITDIYSAGEAPRPGVTGEVVLYAVLDAHPWADVAYLPHLDDVVSWLATVLRPGDLCLTLGAGDLTTIPDRVIAALGGPA